MSAGRRLARFAAVAAAGAGVQLASVWLLGLAGCHYLAATLLAVMAALAHNFAWHRRWTWGDRETGPWVRGFGAFVAANGLVSLGGNTAIAGVLVAGLDLAPVVANGVAIVACGLANFHLGDRVVFRPAPARQRLIQTTISPRSRLAHEK
jgi:putative flippase GtrA